MQNADGTWGVHKIDRRVMFHSLPIYALLEGTLGPDYKYEGHVHPGDERHEHLVGLNRGQPVAVHSFASQARIKFHRAMVWDAEKSGLFHRFGFADPDENDTAVSKRQVVEKSNEYFNTGGLDLFDCAADTTSQGLLNAGDAGDMTSLIKCNGPNFAKAKELSIQVYDAATEETIGSGKIAPYGSDGKHVISGETETDGCPVSEPTQKNCPMENND